MKQLEDLELQRIVAQQKRVQSPENSLLTVCVIVNI